MIVFVAVPKRMYVTTHELQQQKRKKKSVIVCSPRRSPRLTKQQDKIRENLDLTEVTSRKKSMPVNNQKEVSEAPKKMSSAPVKRKLDVDNPPAENEITDENNVKVIIV